MVIHKSGEREEITAHVEDELWKFFRREEGRIDMIPANPGKRLEIEIDGRNILEFLCGQS